MIPCRHTLDPAHCMFCAVSETLRSLPPAYEPPVFEARGPGPARLCNVYRHPDGSVWWGAPFEGTVLIAACASWNAARAAARLLSMGEPE